MIILKEKPIVVTNDQRFWRGKDTKKSLKIRDRTDRKYTR